MSRTPSFHRSQRREPKRMKTEDRFFHNNKTYTQQYGIRLYLCKEDHPAGILDRVSGMVYIE